MFKFPSRIYTFKVSLKGITPLIWRRIEVVDDISFHELHFAIQCAMGWQICQNYAFRIHDFQTSTNVKISDSASDNDFIEASSVKLSSYFTEANHSAEYDYDSRTSGDSWKHSVRLEKILLREEEKHKYPKCTAGKRACPPEDCGFIRVYKDHVRISNDKNCEEYEEHMAWLQECFYIPENPEDFDPKSVSF